jgi:hypothetical protein
MMLQKLGQLGNLRYEASLFLEVSESIGHAHQGAYFLAVLPIEDLHANCSKFKAVGRAT